MTTILYTLKESPKDYNEYQDLHKGPYLNGFCFEFAIALHKELGWPMVCLKKETEKTSKNITHVGVRAPNGMIYDARGPLSYDEFAEGYVTQPFILHYTNVSELYSYGKIVEYAITSAIEIAHILWPELPWKTKTCNEKVKAYVDELEKVSKKHGFWIAGMIPTCLPCIVEGHGDEGGYVVKQTVIGNRYTINRFL